MESAIAWILIPVLLSPGSVQSQEWNAEQLEVWNAVEACWDARDLETRDACYHEDYLSWVLAKGVPRNRHDARASNSRWFEAVETVWAHRKPLNIHVEGNVAVVLYVVDWVDLDRATGVETSGTTNWTEVFVKEGGKWLCLTDHGTEVT